MAAAGLNEKSQDRRTLVLESAMELFLRYGYARVSMDDIAKAAGMSRPALYQFFRNKSDIYQGLAMGWVETVIADMEKRLSGDAPARGRLFDALTKGMLDHVAEMEATTHGAELLGMRDELAGPHAAFTARKAELLTGVFSTVTGKGVAEAERNAWQLIDFLEGMKARVTDRKSREQELAAFLDMQWRGIGAG